MAMANSRSMTPIRFLALFAMLMVAAACMAAASPVRAQAPSAQVDLYEYRLGAADKVRVTVFGEENLTGEFQVSASGRVSMPLIGEVDALGLTVSQLQGSIETKLADGYLRNPRVSVEVLNYRPFYILGEVTKPGEYPYTAALTVLKAVAMAEGFTYRANTRRVFIKRAASSAEQEFALDQETVVGPGDTIRIAERFF